MAHGYLVLLLQAHLPFVRHPEHEFFLEEEWLYEAIFESYLPLLEVLEGLGRDEVPYRICLSFSPALVAMLRDDLLCRRADRHLRRISELVDREIVRTRNDPQVQTLASYYRERLDALRRIWDRLGGDLVGAFSALEAEGSVEILTCAATHAYLPLWQHHPEAVRAQIRVAAQEHERQFGRAPRGIWLPECGFFPGLDRVLASVGLRYFVVDAHGLGLATPRPRFGTFAPVYCAGSGVAAFGREPESSYQVWSRYCGYPGDFDYREFYRDIGWDLPADYLAPFLGPSGLRQNTGIKYHRVTGPTDHKELYDPVRAREKASIHAAHFLTSRERQVKRLAARMGRPPVIVAAYDTELFGHWWYEGPLWLDAVLRQAARGSPLVRLTLPSAYLREMPIQQVASPAQSSWGENGYHEYWLSEANSWIYPHAHRAAEEMRDLARAHAASPPAPMVDRALRQAARELLLAQSSDWAFILRNGTVTDYARRRVVSHLRRFRHLAAQIRGGRVDEAWLARLEATDNLFPALDWQEFL
jgi:1,4-alpha-glucan branching enzyme